MSNSENNEKYILLDNLFNLFLLERFDKDDEQLLKDSNIDVDKIVQKNIMLFRQLKTQTKAELNLAKHARVLDFLVNLKKGLESNIEEYQKLADEILMKPRFAQLQPMFRNLSGVSEQDRKSIIMDAKLLDLLSDIEEEYNIGDKHE